MKSPLKIMSGGQTGVDRAALEWALTNGVSHGGWCPQRPQGGGRHQAPVMRQFANGIDERPLVPASEPQKSYSHRTK
ncbi:MAG: putative molybdenum carrier protein [Verrucomicrobiia bacterium]